MSDRSSARNRTASAHRVAVWFKVGRPFAGISASEVARWMSFSVLPRLAASAASCGPTLRRLRDTSTAKPWGDVLTSGYLGLAGAADGGSDGSGNVFGAAGTATLGASGVAVGGAAVGLGLALGVAAATGRCSE